MKKLLLSVVGVVLFVAVVGGVATVATHRYEQHQKQKQAQAVPMIKLSDANKLVNDVKQSNAAEYTSLQASYNSAVAECQKGAVAYAKLATLTKVLPPAPTCPAAAH